MSWKEFWKTVAMLYLISFGVAVAVTTGIFSVLGLVTLSIG
jgi:hypothetical protein